MEYNAFNLVCMLIILAISYVLINWAIRALIEVIKKALKPIIDEEYIFAQLNKYMYIRNGVGFGFISDGTIFRHLKI
jgi:hypothetical protein